MNTIYYYKMATDNIHVESYTTNKGVAKRGNMNLTTNEEPVMQGDGSGYVLKKDYIEPDTRIENLTKEYENCVKELDSYMSRAQLMGNEEMVADIRAEYALVTAEYDDQISELN